MLAVGSVRAEERLWLSTNQYDLPRTSLFPTSFSSWPSRSAPAGVVADDLFVLARGAAEFNGEHLGDTWVLGGQTSLGGHQRDHVRLAGQSILVRGELERSLYALGSAVVLSTGSVVRGQVVITG